MQHPPFQKGNKHAERLKTKELRQEAYGAYCAWIAKGKVARSFVFIKDGEAGLSCVADTIEEYMEKYPDEFDPVLKQIAHAKGYAYWEQVVDDSAIGTNKDASTASLNLLMRNKFRWDLREPSYYDNHAPKEFDNTLEIVKPSHTQHLKNHKESHATRVD